MKGFETSKDYSILWDLINQGYRIPAWILYSNDYEKPIIDLIEVKILFGRYRIGVRGIGYEGFDHNKEDFSKICSGLDMEFILPTNPTNEQ